MRHCACCRVSHIEAGRRQKFLKEWRRRYDHGGASGTDVCRRAVILRLPYTLPETAPRATGAVQGADGAPSERTADRSGEHAHPTRWDADRSVTSA
jgi:hypothetical protein